MATSKRHHFIPAFYLAGFAGGERRNSSFWCAGKDGQKLFQTNPNNACVENDYYTLTESSYPEAVEKMYSNLEGKFADCLHYLKENNWTPRASDVEILLLLATTLYIRGPEFRNSMATPIKRVREIVLDMQSRITLENARNGADISEEDLLNAVRMVSNRSTDAGAPPVSNDLLIEIELRVLESTVKLLTQRKWYLFFVHECEKCEFITSDNPFVLIRTETEAKMIGLGTRGTEVIIPLHRRAVLIGVFEDGPNCTYHAPREMVAEMNEHIHRGCNRWIYSSRKDVVEQLATNHGRHARSNAER